MVFRHTPSLEAACDTENMKKQDRGNIIRMRVLSELSKFMAAVCDPFPEGALRKCSGVYYD
jgi:hypothetical protein